MKNVLFATTALVAMTGSAMAASHGGMSPTVSFSGEMTAGYNDAIEKGMFWDADLDLTATVDLGDSVTATLTTQIAKGSESVVGTVTFDPTIEIAYTGGSFSASLKVGDLGDKGASEYFYADRDGMVVDVENHDGTTDVRALIEFGNFGVAAGCGIVGGTLSNACAGFNVGVGATFGSFKFGVGYDDSANAGGAVTAVSADAEFGKLSIGVSYATNPTNDHVVKDGIDGNDGDATVVGTSTTYVHAENSVGVSIGYTVGSIEIDAYYANNSFTGDSYGVSAAFAAGAFDVTAYYDQTVKHAHAGIGTDVDGDGYFTGGRAAGVNTTSTSYGVDLGYALNDQIAISAGVKVGSATNYYVGMEYTVNSNITATLSYANADEISGPEFKDGISAFITASF